MYKINIHHRNGNAAKSQWIISEPMEIACFNDARKNEWLLTDKGWGLHLGNNGPECVGVAQDRSVRLFIAKFVGSTDPVQWHGYPADYRSNPHDIPVGAILMKWVQKGIISTAKARKITRGQPCGL